MEPETANSALYLMAISFRTCRYPRSTSLRQICALRGRNELAGLSKVRLLGHNSIMLVSPRFALGLCLCDAAESRRGAAVADRRSWGTRDSVVLYSYVGVAVYRFLEVAELPSITKSPYPNLSPLTLPTSPLAPLTPQPPPLARYAPP